MSESRKLRGYKILGAVKGKNFTLKLFAQNGSRFIIIATYHILGLVYHKKRFEFLSLEEAKYYCQRVAFRKGISPPILT